MLRLIIRVRFGLRPMFIVRVVLSWDFWVMLGILTFGLCWVMLTFWVMLGLGLVFKLELRFALDLTLVYAYR